MLARGCRTDAMFRTDVLHCASGHLVLRSSYSAANARVDAQDLARLLLLCVMLLLLLFPLLMLCIG